MTSNTADLTKPGGVFLFVSTEGGPYRNTGNITSPNIEEALENLEHFTSQSGSRVKDDEITTKAGLTIKFSWDEFNSDTLFFFFHGGARTKEVAASVAIEDEVVTLVGTDTAPLVLPLATQTPITAVKSLDGQTAHTADTDYVLDAVNGGIARKAGGTIVDGEEVVVSYKWAAPARESFPVLTTPIRKCRARMLMLPTRGRQLLWTIPSATIKGAGALSLDDSKYGELPMALEILANRATPSAPFGTISHWRA